MTDEQPDIAPEATDDPGPSDSQAVRTVSEDENVRVIEGRAIPFGGPFNGRDTYGTFFSARTDLALDVPTKVWYQHGFDPDFRYDTLGKVTSYRTEADGVWVQAQLDKRHRYYEERVKPLLDKQGLGFSAGSAEHSYREDAKTGELLSYPVHEISLTPTPSNPFAFIAARSEEITATLVRITAGVRAAEGGVVPADGPTELLVGEPEIIVPAVRAGARNSSADQGRTQQIHDLAAANGAMCPDSGEPDADDAARSADDQPVRITVREDAPDFEAIRAGLLARAEENGKAVAVRVTG